MISTVFLYHGDQWQPLTAASPVTAAPETVDAAAAERAARLFTSLGRDSVILRLGWTSGDAICGHVLTAARRGWRLIDDDPGAWTTMIAQADAARAVPPALTIPPGIYNVTDGRPITQAALNARLAAHTGRELHPLHDPNWGQRGILFGRSRNITETAFRDLTGWHPQIPSAADYLTSGGESRHVPSKRAFLSRTSRGTRAPAPASPVGL